MNRNLHIIWAITTKDIVDALKNKNTLTVILVVLFMIAFYRFMPALEGGEQLSNVLIYDAGASSLVTALDGSSRLKLYPRYTSQEQMENDLASGDAPELGLVVPADFDEALASCEPVELEGYVLHWVKASEANELRVLVESEIADRLGKAVRINLEGNIVYTREDSTGLALMTTISVIFSLVMVGISLVPHLMLDEKHSRTIDALLVSPANSSHIAISKTLTGLFYGLTATAVALAFNAALVTHWALAILAAVCGTLFVVSLGLLLGSLIENRQQLTLWAWVVILPLLLPTMLSFMDDLLPASAVAVMRWMPTVALSRVLRVSFAARAPLADFGPELALIAGCTALTLVVVAWLVRRSDR